MGRTGLLSVGVGSGGDDRSLDERRGCATVDCCRAQGRSVGEHDLRALDAEDRRELRLERHAGGRTKRRLGHVEQLDTSRPEQLGARLERSGEWRLPRACAESERRCQSSREHDDGHAGSV